MMKKRANLRVGVVSGVSFKSSLLTRALKLPFKGLRLFLSVPLSLGKFLLALLVLLILTVAANSLKSEAAAINQTDVYTYYQSDGDFGSDGGDGKQFKFYKYMSDFSAFDWNNLNHMYVVAVSDSHKLYYRITGYRSGGGGTLMFDSGWTAPNTSVDCRGANFDYYLIELRRYDDGLTGEQTQVGYLDTIYTSFSYGTEVQLPTTPPEIVTGIQSIEEAINGGEDETLPQETIELPTLDNSIVTTDVSPNSEVSGFIRGIMSVWTFVFSLDGMSFILPICIVITFVAFVLYGRGAT